ncbi:MAG: ATP-binding cassette domain-containing protein [Acidobacteria bacterium]|nr:ATP-binding cassette domain-containing protein [Acidobacteriota bacterium]
MLQLSGVTKSFGNVPALRDISLTAEPGRTTVLIGPSGCGKSTLLRMMIGLIWPDSGSVSADGTLVTPETILTLRRRMGYVIQDGGLFPHLTARENVVLMARYLGWSATRITDRLTELAALTQFPADALQRFPAQLSGGQKQRVAIMRALMLDPSVILLDEPLGALDPMIRCELQTDLRRIFQTLHKTVVLVTHDIGEAGYFGDVIVLLRDGRIVQQGTLHDFVHAPAEPFVTQFINAQRSPLETLRGTLA